MMTSAREAKMGKKILFAGLAGGVVVFLVSAFFHMATSLGEYGIKQFQNEDAVLATLRASIPESGLYLFPAAGTMSGKDQSRANQAAYLEKYENGPTGILAYRTGGAELEFGRRLVCQFLFGLVGALILAWILGLTVQTTTYGSRVLIVFLSSVFAALVYSLPYWNWYGFPLSYTVAYIATWTLSWTVAGLAMAAILKPVRAGVSTP
jgi:hypothetical protein